MTRKRFLIATLAIFLVVLGAFVTVKLTSDNFKYRNDYIGIGSVYKNQEWWYFVNENEELTVYNKEYIEKDGVEFYKNSDIHFRTNSPSGYQYDLIQKDIEFYITSYGVVIKIKDLKISISKLYTDKINYLELRDN